MTTPPPLPSRRARYPELEARYELQETLGSGGFAKVKAAVHKLTGEKVAVKIMNKESLGADLPRVFREITCLKKLRHQHICQLYEVIETRQMIYLVIEFCPGGELFDYIVAKERLREREARSFFRQILSALRYVHESGFIHRDLKPENLLLDEESNIKLIDFGLVAQPDDPQDLLATCCGSPAYAAPELIRGGPYIGAKADVWSLGVLLYALLNGFLPFDDDHTPYLYKLIQKGEYETPEWLSLESISILKKLLQTDPDRRITVDELLGHRWVVSGHQSEVEWTSQIDLSELDSDCVATLADYNGYSEEAMEDELSKWRYDESTATYLILLQQKLRGKKPTIKQQQPSTTIPRGSLGSTGGSQGTITLSPLVSSLATASFSKEKEREREMNGTEDDREREGEEEDEEGFVSADEELEKEPDKATSPSPVHNRGRRISLGLPMHPPEGEIVNLQKHLEKFIPPEATAAMENGSVEDMFCRSPTPTFTLGEEDEEQLFQSGARSLPTTAHHLLVTPPHTKRSTAFPFSPSAEFRSVAYSSMKQPVKKTCSYDAQLNRIVHNQNKNELIPEPTTPQPTRKKRMGSIPGNLLKKAKRVFTPRSLRRSAAESQGGPRRVKAVYDVTSTSMKPPDVVLSEIERVVAAMGIDYKKKNYTVHCKFNKMPAAIADRKSKRVEFDLEVCFIPTIDMIGVRRKRIRGDTWEFKNICGEIFSKIHI